MSDKDLMLERYRRSYKLWLITFEELTNKYYEIFISSKFTNNHKKIWV